MKRARLTALLIAMALLGLGAAGCGSSSESGGEGRATQSSTSRPAPPRLHTPPGAAAQSCGKTTVSGTEGLRVTGVGCDVGRGVVAVWAHSSSCSASTSRPSCSVYRGYRCIGARTDAGLAVSCARGGSSVSFVARRR